MDNPYVGLINSSEYFQGLLCNNTAEFGNTETIKLDEGDIELPEHVKSLKEIYKNRKSTRAYDESGLTFNELSALLKSSYYNVGEHVFQDINGNSRTVHPRRNIASGGGLYTVDVYVISTKVQNLNQGVYYYNPDNEHLEFVDSPFDEKEVYNAFFTKYRTDVQFNKCSGFIIFVGLMNRSAFKYRDRSIIFTLTDVGALMHSFYLGASALKIGTCGIGGYLEDNLHKILQLKSKQHMVLGTMTFGKL
jgi:SagB-type dehydrogenase family enzyme